MTRQNMPRSSGIHHHFNRLLFPGTLLCAAEIVPKHENLTERDGLMYQVFASLKDLVARAPDGSDNNAGGAVGASMQRVANTFPDEVGTTAAIQATIDAGGLPQTFDVTETVMNAEAGGPRGQPVDRPNAGNFNEVINFGGQFIAHDIVFSRSGDDVLVDRDQDLTRNAFVDDGGVFNQINNETAFLDLGQVYGNEGGAAAADFVPLEFLRDPNAEGMLLTDGNGLLPTGFDIRAAHGPDAPIGIAPPDARVTADLRAGQTEQLLSQHTLWLVNHNYHAEKLAETHTEWTSDQLFAAARALNEAEYQWFVYNEYLPAVVGSNNLEPYRGYDSTIDAGILADFTAAVFRFGHDQANNSFDLLGEDGRRTQAAVTLQESFIFFQPSTATTPELQADWLRGQMGIAHQAIDGFVVEGNRQFVLGGTEDAINNLVSTDINRGRDHGVNLYNDFRDAWDLPRYESLDEFITDNGVPAHQAAPLRHVYGNDINRLETIPAILLEEKIAGAQLGETGTKVMAAQFAAIRDGDAFYFENRFTPEQSEAIKQTSLAEIIMRNADIAVDYVYRDALVAAERLGGSDAADSIRGTRGEDLIIGFDGADHLRGRSQDDDLYGGDGNDDLRGDRGHDGLYGEAGDDRLGGGRGHDELHGGDGDDRLWGRAGRDTLAGGPGDDDLIGGRGHDIFIYEAGEDRLRDFKVGRDSLIIQHAAFAAELHTYEDFWEFQRASGLGDEVGRDAVLDFGNDDTLTLVGLDHLIV
jgi:hypothetical protein